MIIHRSLAAGVGLAALATSAFAQSSTPTAEEIAALRAQVQKGLTPEKRKEFEQLYYRAVEQYLKGGYAAADALAEAAVADGDGVTAL